MAFLEAMEIDRAVLAGHSLGALNALQAAIDAPDRVAGLVLGPGFARAERTPGVDELVSAAQAITDPVDRVFAEQLQGQALEPQLPAGLFAAMVEGTVEMPARVWRALTAGIMAFDARDELGSISAPVLLVWGEQDEIVPRSTQATLVARLRAAELSVHPGGHAPHWDDPKRYAAEVTRLVRSAFVG